MGPLSLSYVSALTEICIKGEEKNETGKENKHGRHSSNVGLNNMFSIVLGTRQVSGNTINWILFLEKIEPTLGYTTRGSRKAKRNLKHLLRIEFKELESQCFVTERQEKERTWKSRDTCGKIRSKKSIPLEIDRVREI